MKKKAFWFILIFCFALNLLATGLPNAQAKSAQNSYREADIIIENGKIITVDQDFSIANAAAVKDGKIVAIAKNPGAQSSVQKWKGPNTKILNLHGETMLPGVNDSHIHLNSWELGRPPFVLDVGYPTVLSISDIVAMVDGRVGEVNSGDWIQGRGWDEGYLEECLQDPNRHPTKLDLDPVSLNNPVLLGDFSGHVVWVNSVVLNLAGITNATPDPPGGTIIRDSSGEPTGVLLENATGLVRGLVPPWTEAQRREAIIVGMQELNSLGITSATDPGITPAVVRLYNNLKEEGDFTVRMNLLLSWTAYGGEGASVEALEEFLNYVGTNTGFGNEWLRIAGLKIFADGIPPSRTGWMWEEYAGGGFGGLVVAGADDDERYSALINMIVLANKKEFQIGIHATGDRAIDACVDGFIQALNEYSWDARHYTIHSDFATPSCAVRMAEYGIGANVQAGIKWTIADYMVSVVGEERAAYQWPLRTLIDAGVHVTGSSDAAVTYPNWLQGVESSVLRESKATGQVSGPEERITREEAIRTYTIEGAWQDHQDDIKGSIEVGKLADFCVLDEDILTIDAHQIKNIPVLMTIVGGNIVYNTAPDRLHLK